MKSLKILVAFTTLACFANTIHAQDYCNKSLCKGRNHVACGNSGVRKSQKKSN